MSSNKKIVFVMPAAATVGGMAAIAKMYYDTGVINQPDYIHFNSSFAGTSKMSRLIQSIGLRFSFIKLLIQQKPAGVFVYTSSYFGFYDKIFYCLCCRLLGIKSALNLVGGEFFKFYNSSALHKTLVKWCMKIPATVVVGSSSWIEPFKKEFKIKQLLLIHNPVIADVAPASKTINGKINFLFFGRLAEEKGVKNILNVLKGFDETVWQKITFTLAGKGPMGGYIRTEMKDLMANGNVQLFENVSDEEKNRLFQNANVFVLPSHAEVLPISLLEAMSNKLPAIVTAMGGMPDAVDEGANGFLITDLNNIETALANRMNYFIDNPHKIEEMGNVARQKIDNQFSFNVVLNKCIGIFN